MEILNTMGNEITKLGYETPYQSLEQNLIFLTSI